MILSFHPIFEADENIICAGRDPDSSDLAAIEAAAAVILPQGCRQSLYEMVRNNCDHFFPNYDTRFQYPGKIGQIQLFREANIPHPQTETFQTIALFRSKYDSKLRRLPFRLPMVLKLNWGDEGDTVFLVPSLDALADRLHQIESFEQSGQFGFLLQEYIPNRNRTLRVVIIGQQLKAYWRIQKTNDLFLSNLSKGAVLDFESDQDLQTRALASMENFCKMTGINLAGFDVLFSTENNEKTPFLLEINYFFGRHGLGGSEAYYRILHQEIYAWLERVRLSYETKKAHPSVRR
jgi:ribosomal protein S6--L-glutamate ligase